VNWDTTPKTTTVTAASGTGYFINTTSGGVTVNLPAGTAGSIVALSDYAATWNTNNVTVNANGTEKIGGVASAPATLNTQGQAVTFVYVDSTRGWINVGDATFVQGNPFVTATGGTVTTCGNYKIHTFTGPGTFTVTNAGQPSGSTTVDYLVIGGGGGAGARWHSAGGGAGGFRESVPSPAAWTASPLANPGGALPVSATSYPITVGAGGSGGASCGNNNGTDGNNSVFSTITAALGGRGGTYGTVGSSGGSGGGGGASPFATSVGGTGNTPPVSPSQGNNGGNGQAPAGGGGGGGGGGAGGAGTNGGNCVGGNGGAGVTTSISGSPTGYAGGSAGSGPSGGGSVPSPSWGSKAGNPAGAGQDARANSGSGGGTTSQNSTPPNGGGSGGSGIVVIRYKFQ